MEDSLQVVQMCAAIFSYDKEDADTYEGGPSAMNK